MYISSPIYLAKIKIKAIVDDTGKSQVSLAKLLQPLSYTIPLLNTDYFVAGIEATEGQLIGQIQEWGRPCTMNQVREVAARAAARSPR